MNIFKLTVKACSLLLLVGLTQTAFAQSEEVDEVEYEEAPNSISEDNDDRLRRQQEEEVRNRTHYYSAPSAGSASNEDGANPPNPGDDPGAPIDGGLSVLLAAGAAYGVRRRRKPRTPNPDNNREE
jgi:hypothetical protein